MVHFSGMAPSHSIIHSALLTLASCPTVFSKFSKSMRYSEISLVVNAAWMTLSGND